MWKALLIASYLIGSVPVLGLKKQWTKNWNLENSDNWNGPPIDCGNIDAFLPQNLEYSTFIGSKLSLVSLTLPSHGEILFGDGAELMVGGSEPPRGKQGCHGGKAEAKWVHTGRDKWWDSLSWGTPSELQPNGSSVPDTHRVPCTKDIAVLPDGDKYLTPIHFTPPSITITAFTIGIENFTTSQTLDYATYVGSSKLFTGRSSPENDIILYAEEAESCTDKDCKCNPNRRIQTTICNNFDANKCPEVKCDKPVRMKGFCCDFCGADLTVPNEYSGNLASLESLAASIAKEEEFLNIAYYVGLMEDNLYHVFFTQKEPNSDYAMASELFKKALVNKMGKSSADKITLLVAGSSAWQKEKKSQATATVVIVILLLVMVVALCYYVHKKGIPNWSPSANYRFRRMSQTLMRRMSRISLHGEVLSSRRESEASSTATTSYNTQAGLRFSNPVFSKSTASLAAMPIDPEGETTTGAPSATQENPMYQAYEYMTPEERLAAEEPGLPSKSASKPTRQGPSDDEDREAGVMRFSTLATIEENIDHSNEEERPDTLEESTEEKPATENNRVQDIENEEPKENESKSEGETKIMIDLEDSTENAEVESKSDELLDSLVNLDF